MSTQLLARLSLEQGTRARRLIQQLEALYPLAFVMDPESRVKWLSSAWKARCSEGTDSHSCVSEFCTRHALPDAISCLSASGGLLRARVELPGSGGPADLSLFSLATDDSHEPCYVAISRPGDEPREELARPLLLDEAPQPLLAVDRQGFVVYANPAAEELLQIGADRLEGSALAALVVDAEGLEALLHAFDGPANGEFAITLRGSQGGGIPVVARAAPRHRPDGSADGLVMAFRADARGSETELARRNDELEHCVNALAHDLRSPLVALLGFSRLLR